MNTIIIGIIFIIAGAFLICYGIGVILKHWFTSAQKEVDIEIDNNN